MLVPAPNDLLRMSQVSRQANSSKTPRDHAMLVEAIAA
jgi:hypothetical protein